MPASVMRCRGWEDLVVGDDGGRAADGGPDAGCQFLDAEGLGDVVVAAAVEGVDLVGGVGVRGEHDDRRPGEGAELGDDVGAVEVGEAEVEDAPTSSRSTRTPSCTSPAVVADIRTSPAG